MYAYSTIEHELEMLDEMIENEMHKVKDRTLSKIDSCLAHSRISLTSLARAIAYGYWESNEDAITVSEQLDLGKLEFLAMADDFDGFKEEYLKNYEQAENF